MRLAALGIGAVVVAAGVVVGVLLLRPPVSVASTVDADVTIECDASTGLSAAACGAWGDAQLAEGPPSSTFEMDDLARLALGRSMLGFGTECTVTYAIERYPDQAAWTEPVACP